MFYFKYEWNIFLEKKFGISFPIPIRNHFYKGRRLSFYKHWFCKTCYHVFNLHPKRFYKKLKMSVIKCPKCSSSDIVHGTYISQAIIDKKTPKEILDIIEIFRYKKSVANYIRDRH